MMPPEFFHPIRTFTTPQNRILIFCLCKAATLAERDMTLFKPNSECDAVKLVASGDELCFSSHTDILRDSFLWESHWEQD